MSDRRVIDVPTPEGMAEALEALPDASLCGRHVTWTEDMDALLLKYWPVKRKEDVAKVLGLTPNPCRNRYRELTGGK